ncbi:MAG: DUF4405 domain-containing protein [Alphaproteobacteria bacterium]|nr:DUF4405 domain-containing protein [Alphaproteobacteria bacterium]
MRQAINSRGLISFLVFGGFLVMTLTGLVLYVVPPGRVANWIDWALFGLSKEQWADIHITFSLLFVIAGIVHLFFNWKPFLHYLGTRLLGHFQMRWEGVATLAILILMVAGTLAPWPPFTQILAFNEVLRNSWSTGADAEPPFGHAEEVTLQSLADKMRFDAQEALDALRDAGLHAEGKSSSVRQIANANKRSPSEIYAIIAAKARKGGQAGGPTDMTAQDIDAKFAGTGMGRKTVAQAAADAGVPANLAINRLTAAGFQALPDERLKDIAARHEGKEAMDLFKIMVAAKP